MWFEERSWSNLKMSSLIVEEWRDLWSTKVDLFVALLSYVFATTNFLNLPRLIFDNGGCKFIYMCLFFRHYSETFFNAGTLLYNSLFCA